MNEWSRLTSLQRSSRPFCPYLVTYYPSVVCGAH